MSLYNERFSCENWRKVRRTPAGLHSTAFISPSGIHKAQRESARICVKKYLDVFGVSFPISAISWQRS